jgi:hypothetical protein
MDNPKQKHNSFDGGDGWEDWKESEERTQEVAAEMEYEFYLSNYEQ